MHSRLHSAIELFGYSKEKKDEGRARQDLARTLVVWRSDEKRRQRSREVVGANCLRCGLGVLHYMTPWARAPVAPELALPLSVLVFIFTVTARHDASVVKQYASNISSTSRSLEL